jgi:hypothetical protein
MYALAVYALYLIRETTTDSNYTIQFCSKVNGNTTTLA